MPNNAWEPSGMAQLRRAAGACEEFAPAARPTVGARRLNAGVDMTSTVKCGDELIERVFATS